jgi:cyanate lyase
MAKKNAKPRRSKLLADQVRQAIDDSGLTRYRISKETGISETALALFYNGQRGLSTNALNKLGECLQLTITLGRKPDSTKKGN